MRKSKIILGIGAISCSLLGGLITGVPAAATTVPPLTTVGTWTYNLNPLNDLAPGGAFTPTFGMDVGFLGMGLRSINTVKPEIASHWTMSHGVLSVYLNPNARWSDGKPVTAQDVAESMDLYIEEGFAQATDLQSMRVVNTHEIQFVEEHPNPYFAWNLLTQGVLPPSVYHQYILPNALTLYQQAHYTGTNKALTARAAKISTRFATLTKDLAALNVTSNVTAGPYVVTKITPSDGLLVKNPYFVLANQVKVPEVSIMQSSSSEAGLLLAGRVDFLQGIGVVTGPVLKAWESNPNHHVVFGTAESEENAVFNTSFYPLNLQPVRQALTYVINRVQLSNVSNPYIPIAFKIPIGGYFCLVERHGLVPASWLSKLNPYNPSASKATKLLESAGFRKNAKGAWLLPNGKPFTLTVTAPSGSFVARETEMAAQLTAFGIPTEAKSINSGIYWAHAAYTQQAGGYEIPLEWAYGATLSAYGVGAGQLGIDYGYSLPGNGTWIHTTGDQSLPNGGIVKLPNGTTVNIVKTIADMGLTSQLKQTGTNYFNLLQAENILAPGDTLGGGVLPWLYLQHPYTFPKAITSPGWAGWGITYWPNVLVYAIVWGGVHPSA